MYEFIWRRTVKENCYAKEGKKCKTIRDFSKRKKFK